MAMTKRDADRLTWDPAGPSKQILWDESVPGFGCRVYESGTKSFVLFYRMPGGRSQPSRLMVLGRYGVLTVDQARKKARQKLNAIVDGTDPLEERRRPAKVPTLNAFSQDYLDMHAKPHKKSWREDERRLNTYILPALGRKRLDAVTRGDVAALHADIGGRQKHPYEANRVLALIGVMYSKAVEWDMLSADVASPATHVQSFAEKSRERWVTPAELPRLLKAIEGERSPYVRAAFMLYLLTGLRRSELLTLTWEDVDLDRREIQLKDTKAGRPHRVPLSAPAADLLEGLARWKENGHVFPARGKAGHMADLKEPWWRIRKRAKLTDVRLHDLRRTVGSLLALDGNSLQLIGKVLNHAETKTTEIYARLTDEAAREALDRHGAKIIEMDKWRRRAS